MTETLPSPSEAECVRGLCRGGRSLVGASARPGGAMRSQDQRVWFLGQLPLPPLLQIGASSPGLCHVPSGLQVPSQRPAQANQMGTAQ